MLAFSLPAGGQEAAMGPGKVVLLDKGSYHLGDGKFNRYAADEALLTQQVVGPRYSVPFRVDKDGKLSVRIGRVLGADSGSTLELYGGIKAGGTVFLERVEGGKTAGRKEVGIIGPEHNQGSFTSRPVAVRAGVYLVTVESNPYTLFDRDDIQIEEIALTTDDLSLSIEPLWAEGRVYSGKLDLSLVPTSRAKEKLDVELAGPPPKFEEPPTPEPSGRRKGGDKLDLDLEVEGRGAERR